MLRVSVVFLAVIACTLAKDQDEKTNDESLYITKCCKKPLGKPETKVISMECYNGKFKTDSEVALCLATKKGITTPDGQLDIAKVNKYIEDEFEADPDLITVIKKACVEGDASKYGPPDSNEVTKFISCESYQLLMTCTDDVPCHGGGSFRFKRIE